MTFAKVNFRNGHTKCGLYGWIIEYPIKGRQQQPTKKPKRRANTQNYVLPGSNQDQSHKLDVFDTLDTGAYTKMKGLSLCPKRSSKSTLRYWVNSTKCPKVCDDQERRPTLLQWVEWTSQTAQWSEPSRNVRSNINQVLAMFYWI